MHQPKMVNAASRAVVGVFILSKGFITSEWPIWELNIFLDRRGKKELGGDGENMGVGIFPVFYDIGYGETHAQAIHDAPREPIDMVEENLLGHVGEYTGEVHTWETFETAVTKNIATKVKAHVDDCKWFGKCNCGNTNEFIIMPGKQYQVSRTAEPYNIWNTVQRGDEKRLPDIIFRDPTRIDEKRRTFTTTFVF